MSSSQETLAASLRPIRSTCSATAFQGLFIACGILTVWAVSLAVLLSVSAAKLNPIEVVFAMLWQTFLYTGLFITAHDAMHGVVFPLNPRVNNFIGSLALTIYGLFSFKDLLKKHWQHHHYPASQQDPDFHDGWHKNFFAWYGHFMMNYWSWWRLLGLAGIFQILFWVLHVPVVNLILFWSAPAILSSLQLFYFGTFLTHREPEGGYDNSLRAQSTYYPPFLSFITCYHFGYHREHHEFPHIPWWQLSAIAKPHSPTAVVLSE